MSLTHLSQIAPEHSIQPISDAHKKSRSGFAENIKRVYNANVSLEDVPQPRYGKIIHAEKQRHITKSVEEYYGFSDATLNGGVCGSASIHYLTKSLVDKTDYWSWLSENSAKWEVVSQYLNDDYSVSSPIDAQLKIQESIKDWGMRHEGTAKVNKGEYDSDELTRVLTQGDGEKFQARLCLMSKTNGPAHAIAAIKAENGMIRLMDPNFGEMEFKDESELDSWMENVFEKKYGFYDKAHVNYYSVK